MKCDIEMAVGRLEEQLRRDAVTIMYYGGKAIEEPARHGLTQASYFDVVDRMHVILNEEGVVEWWNPGRRDNDWKPNDNRYIGQDLFG